MAWKFSLSLGFFGNIGFLGANVVSIKYFLRIIKNYILRAIITAWCNNLLVEPNGTYTHFIIFNINSLKIKTIADVPKVKIKRKFILPGRGKFPFKTEIKRRRAGVLYAATEMCRRIYNFLYIKFMWKVIKINMGKFMFHPIYVSGLNPDGNFDVCGSRCAGDRTGETLSRSRKRA